MQLGAGQRGGESPAILHTNRMRRRTKLSGSIPDRRPATTLPLPGSRMPFRQLVTTMVEDYDPAIAFFEPNRRGR